MNNEKMAMPQNGMYSVVFTAVAVIALIALVLVLVLFRSQADDTSQSIVVGNASPTVDTVTTALTSLGADQTSVSPTEGTTTTIYFHGAATDNNGCQDINSVATWSSTLYRTNATNAELCTRDNNDCYDPVAASLALSGCTGAGDLSLAYEGQYARQFYADPTDTGAPQAATNWTVWVKAVDASSASGTATDTSEWASLNAVDVTASVSYGTVALGADSTQQSILFTNTGNRAIDVNQTGGGNMVCNGTGSQDIAIGQAHISATNGFTYGTADQALTTTSTAANISLAQRTNDAAAQTTTWYAKLRMPSTGVRGTCTNTITFTAATDV